MLHLRTGKNAADSGLLGPDGPRRHALAYCVSAMPKVCSLPVTSQCALMSAISVRQSQVVVLQNESGRCQYLQLSVACGSVCRYTLLMPGASAIGRWCFHCNMASDLHNFRADTGGSTGASSACLQRY
jgi:hypothetical protein